MYRRSLLLTPAALLLLGSRARASNQTPALASLTWEGIHREFARRSLSDRLLRQSHGTWAQLDEFFTDEMRVSLAARVEHTLPPETDIDILLLEDARLSHCEQLDIDRNASWDHVVNKQMHTLSERMREVYLHFVLGQLYNDQAAFWNDRVDQLFPFAAIEFVPLRPQDDTI